MAALTQNNGFNFHTGRNIEMKHFNYFLLLFFASAVVFAQGGITNLPESYRTPLSDMTYDDQTEWRAEPKDENPWREGDKELLIKPRIKIEIFPQYTPDSSGNPVSRSLIQNEDEVEKPASNFFEYTF